MQFSIDETQTTLIDQSIINGFINKSFAITFRYDYNLKLTQKESVFNLYIGVSTSLGYETEVNEPKITSSFKKSFYAFNSNIGIVPRIIWKLNTTVFLDLNTPINVFQIRYDHIRIQNPSLTMEQQQYGEFSTKLLPINYEVCLGIGVFLFDD